MPENLIGPLGLPGWLAALAFVFWLGVKATCQLKDSMHQKTSERNSLGKSSPSVQANLISALASLVAAVDSMSEDLVAVRETTTSMSSRLDTMPTRENIKDIAGKNRQLLREEVTKIMNRLGEVETKVTERGAQ